MKDVTAGAAQKKANWVEISKTTTGWALTKYDAQGQTQKTLEFDHFEDAVTVLERRHG